MTESRLIQLSQDALNGLNATAPVVLECLNEIKRLKYAIAQEKFAFGTHVTSYLARDGRERAVMLWTDYEQLRDRAYPSGTATKACDCQP